MCTCALIRDNQQKLSLKASLYMYLLESGHGAGHDDWDQTLCLIAGAESIRFLSTIKPFVRVLNEQSSMI